MTIGQTCGQRWTVLRKLVVIGGALVWLLWSIEKATATIVHHYFRRDLWQQGVCLNIGHPRRMDPRFTSISLLNGHVWYTIQHFHKPKPDWNGAPRTSPQRASNRANGGRYLRISYAECEPFSLSS